MKTLKQIADELGISKDKVKYQSKKLPSKYLVKKEDGITYVTYAGIELIKKALGDKVGNVTQGTTQEITSELPTELLKPYLDQIAELKKDKEILNNRLSELDQTIKQAFYTVNEAQKIVLKNENEKETLQIELNKKNEELEEKEQLQKELQEIKKQLEEKEKKKKWFWSK